MLLENDLSQNGYGNRNSQKDRLGKDRGSKKERTGKDRGSQKVKDMRLSHLFLLQGKLCTKKEL